MRTDYRAELASIKRFDQLVRFLRDRMGWPIESDDFEELTFEYTPEELGIDPKNAAKIQEIKRLRPLAHNQPWGIFFVKFEPKKLPVVALRRILSRVALKKRASANSAERQAWAADDLLFVSNYGDDAERRISFAHFAKAQNDQDLPTLKVLGWDDLDTALHLDDVAKELTENLAWPEDESDVEAWREHWRAAFPLQHQEVVQTSKALAVRLAHLARDIRKRIKGALAIEAKNGPLTKLMDAFRETLVHDLDTGDFADMYAQTIAYGLLSARIADPDKKTADDFAGHMRTNPFLRELMQAFLQVGRGQDQATGPGIDFDELGVGEVVAMLDQANMEAVVRDFGDRNPAEDPVIHFYELFLKEYDAEIRLKRGVFYTPRPVVSFIVRSVDELLRTEFGLEDGLADATSWGAMVVRHKDLVIPEGVPSDQPFVQVLDPATGTGTFLVEAIDLIHSTMFTKWKAQGYAEQRLEELWNEYVPKSLLPRLHGYELLMAPYAIAHLKIGLKLYETGYHFDGRERARVYLTNTLEPAQDFSGRFEFAIPALAHEAQAVNEIKRAQRFTVILGNPPYSALSANLTDQARSLVKRFKFIKGVRLDERGALQLEKNLQDDYIKFLAFAEDRLASTAVGVLGIICNHGFIDNPTLRGVRWSLLSNFDRIWTLDLHGNVNRGEAAPDGSDDQNVFDIKEAGVAILLSVKRQPVETSARQLRKSDLWGNRESVKYPFLLSESVGSCSWLPVASQPDLFLFRALGTVGADEYFMWPKVTAAFPLRSIGIITARDSYVIDFEPEQLVDRVTAFRDSLLPDEEACRSLGIPIKKGWNIRRSRERITEVHDLASCVKTLLYRPFDFRSVFYHESLIWGMAWPVMQHMVRGNNLALVTTRMTKGEAFGHTLVSNTLSEVILLSSKTSNNAFVFPLYLQAGGGRLDVGPQVNLSPEFLRSLGQSLGLVQANGEFANGVSPEDVFNYIYASLNSPGFRTRYAEFLQIDFPHLPLPGSLELFRSLGQLGGELVALHLMEAPELNGLITNYLGPPEPEVERVVWMDDTVWLDAAPTKRGQPAALGTIGFSGVPEEVWNFHVGGYQVCQKWLKDRRGRVLSTKDIIHYQKIVVALSETIRLMKEIDEVIEKHGGWPGAFQEGSLRTVQVTTPAKPLPFRPRIVQPDSGEQYVNCAPLVPLQIAAGAFGDPQHVEENDWEWVALESKHRLRQGMFVAQVVGKSMEPLIPEGSFCLFSSPVAGSRQEKVVLAQLLDTIDPETGNRYTVKRYESQKSVGEESWRHQSISLNPVNPDFAPIVVSAEDQVQVIAEFLEVVTASAGDGAGNDE